MEKKAKDDELLKFNHSYYQQGKSLKIFSILFHLINHLKSWDMLKSVVAHVRF